jgi:hypothetical protein
VSAIIKLISSWLCPRLALGTRAPANRRDDGGEPRREPPIVLAEIVAASSLVDFGGVPDARYFLTLYDWRLSEAERDTGKKRSDKDGCLPRRLIASFRNDISEDDPAEEQLPRGRGDRQDASQRSLQFMLILSLSRVPLSLLNSHAENPYGLRPLWGDREFLDGSEIRGIREKIAKGLVKRLLPASSARNAG